MNCKAVKRRLAETSLSPEVTRHIASCATCARYRDRLHLARAYFREHHVALEPDAGFAHRVAARLPGQPVDLMGRFALRLLPATVALIVVLAWFAAGPPTSPSGTTAEPVDDDLLSWVLHGEEGSR